LLPAFASRSLRRMNGAGESAVEAKLIRALGVPALTANIVNSTVGAGIFVLPALVARDLGPAAPLAFLICAAAMVIFVTCFAIAGSRVPLTGGLYAYIEVAFGPYVGYLAGVLYAITAISAVAGVGNVLVDSIAGLIPSLGNPVIRVLLMFLVYGSLAVINIRSVRFGAAAVGMVTVAKLLPLLVFVGVGIFFIHPAGFAWQGLPASKSLGDAVLQLLFAFVGIEVALIPSGEVKQSARTVPRAIYLSLAITTILYLLIQIVAQGTLGPELGNNLNTPLAEAASRFLGSFGRTFLVVGASVSAFGFITSDILSSPRMLFAVGRDGVLPKWFAHVHPRYHSPDIAILCYTFIAFVLSVCSSFEGLVVLSNVAVLLMYLLCFAGIWPLIRRPISADARPVSFPGMQLIPALAIVGIVCLFWLTQPWDKIVRIGAILAAASILYLVRIKLPRRIS
jgi:basic amino acid/polyamine antiporter, APA family